MAAYPEYRSERWNQKWIGSSDKIVQAIQGYDDAAWPLPPEVKDFLLATLHSARDVDGPNALVVETAGTWLVPKDGSARFPLEFSIEFSRATLLL